MNLILFKKGHWIQLYAGLNTKDKRFLKKYYSSLYPRKYVRSLIAALDKNYVQLKESQQSSWNRYFRSV